MSEFEDYEWFISHDLSKYTDEWVAILDKCVVEHAKELSVLIKKVKEKFPRKKPLIVKIRKKFSIL